METKEPSPYFHFLKDYKDTVEYKTVILIFMFYDKDGRNNGSLSWTRERRIFMLQKGKKGMGAKLKCLTAAAALGIALSSVSPATSAFANSNEKPKFEFGIVPDIQYCDCDASGTRFYRNSVDKLREASQTFNKEDVDFTVQTGDIIDRNLSSFSTILPTL